MVKFSYDRYMSVKGAFTHGNRDDEYFCGLTPTGRFSFTKDPKSDRIQTYSKQELDSLKGLITQLRSKYPDKRISIRVRVVKLL